MIKNLRNLVGWSQTDLAEKLDVHQTLVSKLEAGLVELRTETEERLYKVFDDAGIGFDDVMLLQSVFSASKLKAKKKDWSGVR